MPDAFSVEAEKAILMLITLSYTVGGPITKRVDRVNLPAGSRARNRNPGKNPEDQRRNFLPEEKWQ